MKAPVTGTQHLRLDEVKSKIPRLQYKKLKRAVRRGPVREIVVDHHGHMHVAYKSGRYKTVKRPSVMKRFLWGLVFGFAFANPATAIAHVFISSVIIGAALIIDVIISEEEKPHHHLLKRIT